MTVAGAVIGNGCLGIRFCVCHSRFLELIMVTAMATNRAFDVAIVFVQMIIKHRREKMLLSQCIENYLEDCYALSDSTRGLYAYHLDHFLSVVGDRPMKRVTTRMARRFMANLRQKNGEEYSRSYEDQVYRTLNTFFKWAVREREMKENPMDRVRKPRVPKRKSPRLQFDEVERLMDAVIETTPSIRNLAIVSLMVDSGLRRGEVLDLELSKVDLYRRAVTAFGKDKEDREVPMGPVTFEAMEAYLAIRPESTSEKVFLTEKGTPLTRNGLQIMMYRLKERSDLPKLRCHLLRHTFANHYISGGGNLRKLQKLLGHSRVRTTADLYTDP
ncbi:MAG: tyrosine-type recombinase/integrase, partial [Candidatus Odinarchaeota archaeon]